MAPVVCLSSMLCSSRSGPQAAPGTELNAFLTFAGLVAAVDGLLGVARLAAVIKLFWLLLLLVKPDAGLMVIWSWHALSLVIARS